MGSLDRVREILPQDVLEVVERETPIPTIAQTAGRLSREDPTFVRADIGQIVSVDSELEVLYGPPVGIEPLREALAEFWSLTFRVAEHTGTALKPENVAVTTGAAEALTLLFRCFGSEKTVALPRGYWENYVNGVALGRGRPVVVDYFDAQGRLDIDGLSRQIDEMNVRCLVSNFPSNPTGAVLSEEDAEQIARLVQDKDIVMIADEVYSRLRFDGHSPISLLPFAPSHVVSISSASKEYLLPGARVGYILSARSELTNAVLRKLIRANTASPNVLGQERVLALLQEDLKALRAGEEPALLVKIRAELSARRDQLVSVLSRHGMSTVGRPDHEPMGTIFLMAGLPEWWSGNDTEFVDAALERKAFSAIPGSAFGIPESVRFSFGSMEAKSIQELDRRLQEWKAGIS